MLATYTHKVEGVESSKRYYRNSRKVATVQKLGSSSPALPREPTPLALMMDLGERHL